jgi:membrane-associated protein
MKEYRVHTLAVNVLDPTSLLSTFGTFGIFAVLFAETGLLVGFFLPGDSLLFTAGLLTAAAGALAGAQVGYLIGRRGGPALLARSKNAKLQQAAARSTELLARYGHGKAIVLARFVPLVRTVLNPLAGALDVPARVFTLWQVIGGLGWTLGITIAGHLLGASIPGIDQYLLPIIAVIVILSLIPVVLEVRRARAERREATRDSVS